MLDFLKNNWNDLLLTLVGLSAFAIYIIQKRDAFRSAATLVSGQIDIIEKRISSLKDAPQLGNIPVFHSKSILKENMWEQYKHLFVKKLSRSEYDLIQQFFDDAEQIERARTYIISTITCAWADKSSAELQIAAKMAMENIRSEALNPQQFQEEISIFIDLFDPLDIVFTPDIAKQALIKNLNNFNMLSGTTAYEKIQKHSYSK